MANIQNINVSTPNDGLGDSLRNSQIKANENFAELNDKKVEKIAGKDLSKNDFTDVLQAKLNEIQAGAEVNAQSDWNQEDDQADDFIKNKPVGQFLQAFGTLHYSNNLAVQNAVANTELKLLNNSLGIYTNLSNAPFGVGSIWNTTTNQFDFSSLEVGDYIELRPDLDIDLVGTNTSYSLYAKMAVGGVNPWTLNICNGERKSTDLFNTAPYIGFDISNEETRDFPAEIYIKTDANATVKVNGWLLAITRKSVNIIDIQAGDEYVANKQNDLTVDGTGVKYPTVDAINNNVVKLTTNQAIDDTKTFLKPIILQSQTNTNQAELYVEGSELVVKNGDGLIPFKINRGVMSLKTISNSLIRFLFSGSARDYTLPTTGGTLALVSDLDAVAQNAIPLSGTEVGKPITGDLEFGEFLGIKYQDEFNISRINGNPTNGIFLYSYDIVNDTYSQMQLSATQLLLLSTRSDFRGLSGDSNYSPNITDLDYTQKIYVDNAVTAGAETTTTILTKIGNGALIDQQYLPSFVDDVLEFANLASFPVTGAIGKIYIAIDTSKQYRWTGSLYLQITNGLIGSTNDVPDSTNKRYQTDNQRTFNDATSSIQTQLNSKANLANPTFTGSVVIPPATASNEAVNLSQLQSENNVYQFHDFLTNNNSAGVSFAIVNSGTVSFNQTNLTVNNPGKITLNSSTTSNSGVALRSSGNVIILKGQEVCNFIINPLTFANTTFRAGVHESATSADAFHGVYFEYSNSGVLTFKTANNGSRTTSATITTLSINTWYKLRITVNANATSILAEVFNNVGVLTASVTQTTNIPTTARFLNWCAIATNSGTTATPLIDVDFMDLKQTLIR